MSFSYLEQSLGWRLQMNIDGGVENERQGWEERKQARSSRLCLTNLKVSASRAAKAIALRKVARGRGSVVSYFQLLNGPT